MGGHTGHAGPAGACRVSRGRVSRVACCVPRAACRVPLFLLNHTPHKSLPMYVCVYIYIYIHASTKPHPPTCTQVHRYIIHKPIHKPECTSELTRRMSLQHGIKHSLTHPVLTHPVYAHLNMSMHTHTCLDTHLHRNIRSYHTRQSWTHLR